MSCPSRNGIYNLKNQQTNKKRPLFVFNASGFSQDVNLGSEIAFYKDDERYMT
jgi:hypothetical protein